MRRRFQKILTDSCVALPNFEDRSNAGHVNKQALVSPRNKIFFLLPQTKRDVGISQKVICSSYLKLTISQLSPKTNWL